MPAEHEPETPRRTDAYQSYLLRLWRVRRAAGRGCQIVLVSAHTGQEWRFGSLAALLAFLEGPPESLPAEDVAGV